VEKNMIIGEWYTRATAETEGREFLYVVWIPSTHTRYAHAIIASVSRRPRLVRSLHHERPNVRDDRPRIHSAMVPIDFAGMGASFSQRWRAVRRGAVPGHVVDAVEASVGRCLRHSDCREHPEIGSECWIQQRYPDPRVRAAYRERDPRRDRPRRRGRLRSRSRRS
jgi:hypothetical protein